MPLSGSSDPGAFYTPSQVRTAYGLNSISGQGQGETIAIVDAYSQPNIQSDVNEFSSFLGLPKMDGVGSDPTLSIMVPTGQSTPPPANTEPGNWGVEISLDVEWAHSIAPYANIDLITCQNSSGDSLFGAEIDGQPYASGVDYAKSLPGVVVVSNSYGGAEFNGETNYDSQFTTPTKNVAFVFAAGDKGTPVSIRPIRRTLWPWAARACIQRQSTVGTVAKADGVVAVVVKAYTKRRRPTNPAMASTSALARFRMFRGLPIPILACLSSIHSTLPTSLLSSVGQVWQRRCGPD